MSSERLFLEEQDNRTSEAVAGADGVGDSLYPQLGNGGYDVQHYNLDINVTDVASSNLRATTTIEAEATKNLSSFNLDFAGFEISDITVNGESAEFSRNEGELTITPTRSLHQGDDFDVAVSYSGSPEPVTSLASDIGFPSGWVNIEEGSYVLGEPNGAENYYPVNNHPLDKASYTFEITIPKSYEVAANGILEETIDNGDSNTYIFQANDPMASYLSTINIDTDFRVERDTSADGVPIRNYFAEDIPREKLEPFSRQPEMIDYFSHLFGTYPFEVYGSVVVDSQIFTGALETQTLSIFGLEILDAPILEEIVAHELAHQWFGNSLSLTDWSDIWLNESFATYAQGLWVEESQGTEAYDTWVQDLFFFTAYDSDNLVVPGEPPANDLFNVSSVYYKGAIGLHILRQEIGDDAFFDSLRTYNERFQGGNVVPEDFIQITEEISGQELDSIYDRWIYSEELPSIPELGLFAGTVDDDIVISNDANEAETIAGLSGNDTLLGLEGINYLVGNSGDDVLYGGGEQNSFYGGTGNDTIFTVGKGDSIIFEEEGNDIDTIWLSGGNDQIYLTDGEGYDVINNFQVGLTTLVVGAENIDRLSFVDSARGVRILQDDNLLAIATARSANLFSNNKGTIFV